jgi:hypothetical protein
MQLGWVGSEEWEREGRPASICILPNLSGYSGTTVDKYYYLQESRIDFRLTGDKASIYLSIYLYFRYIHISRWILLGHDQVRNGSASTQELWPILDSRLWSLEASDDSFPYKMKEICAWSIVWQAASVWKQSRKRSWRDEFGHCLYCQPIAGLFCVSQLSLCSADLWDKPQNSGACRWVVRYNKREWRFFFFTLPFRVVTSRTSFEPCR